jgi:hypothetical protein
VSLSGDFAQRDFLSQPMGMVPISRVIKRVLGDVYVLNVQVRPPLCTML